MKSTRLVLLLLALLLSTVSRSASGDVTPRRHRIVFEVTMEGVEPWTVTLNNVENVRVALGRGDTEVEVVCHGKGLGMLLAKDNPLADRMQKLADAGVVFAACENTMKRKNVTREQLLPFAQSVDSGVAETVRRQEAGWSYLKSGA